MMRRLRSLWAAIRAELDRPSAEELIQQHFAAIDLRRYVQEQELNALRVVVERTSMSRVASAYGVSKQAIHDRVGGKRG